MSSTSMFWNKVGDDKTRMPVSFIHVIDKIKENRLQSVFYMTAGYLAREFACNSCSLLLMDNSRIRILTWKKDSRISDDKILPCNADDVFRFASVKWSTPSSVIRDRLAVYFDISKAEYDSFVLSPIFLGDCMQGAICITRDSKMPFLEKDRAFLQMLASKMCLVVVDTIQAA